MSKDENVDKLHCRFCDSELNHTFVDLGMSPLSNAYLKQSALQDMEPFYPLHAYVCESCYLVQLGEFQSPDQIFSDYAYFSSYSESWLQHCKNYTEKMVSHFGFNGASKVVELASNDGYLLQYFKQQGVPVLGVEPAKNVAQVAIAAGIPTEVEFFGVDVAKVLRNKHGAADLLLGNNVLAHVPNLNDFVAGMKHMLADAGVITMEFPHLLQLMQQNQFDTIYHEHFSYLSFFTVNKVFAKHGLTLFDVEELPTHGGSLRVYARHTDNQAHEVTENVAGLLEKELAYGFDDVETYERFSTQVQSVKNGLLEFLIKAKREGKSVAGYGAAAKGNTLLNYCGIRTDYIDYVVDQSPHKQGRYLPGTHIPICAVEKIYQTKPDYVLILPWNLTKEIVEQMAGVREWGAKFVTPIPELRVIE